jgi:hypothetical protein
MITTPYAPDGLLLAATIAAMRSARCFDIADAVALATSFSPQLKIICKTEASVCDNVFIVQCLCWAGCWLCMPRRCLSASRLNVGIHFRFHVMMLVDRPDAEVRKEPHDQ